MAFHRRDSDPLTVRRDLSARKGTALEAFVQCLVQQGPRLVWRMLLLLEESKAGSVASVPQVCAVLAD